MTKELDQIDFSKLTELDGIDPKLKDVALKILQEYSDSGYSEVMNQLTYDDYKEIPVDIITFVKDSNYLGKAWHLPSGKCKLFPYWEKRLKELFPDNLTTSVNNVILSGARGLGKSEIAVTIGLYLMYRLMCLKNPYEVLNLKPTEKVAFAFMNITEALAMDIGVNKFQATVQASPWFMARGTVTGKAQLIWNPPDFINIIIGSQPRHVIGQPIYYCLDGDTEILTDTGISKIRDLTDKQIKVFTVSADNSIELSESCTVKQTAESDIEYEIELDDGSVVKCTPTHRFMLSDGSYIEAKDLKVDDDLYSVEHYGYIYKVINNINNKLYIGQKKSSKFLGCEYLGSGDLIRKAVSKYGKDNFSVDLLDWADSKTELDAKEKYYIESFDATNVDIGYNLASGGQGGDFGPTIRAKISAAGKGHQVSESTRNKLRNALLGRHLTDSTKMKISAANKGKILSKDTRAKMSQSAKKIDRSSYKTLEGKIVITDGNVIRYIDPEIKLPEGWSRGNCKTSGKHDMTNYYASEEMQKRNSASKSGCKNSMFKHGYKISNGNNGKAIYEYWFRDQYFNCRKTLVNYLKSEIDSTISENAIRNVQSNTYGIRTIRKYPWLISDLKWKLKDEG